ncbi:MAG: hypothetical protein HGB12_13490, partial [Bacteroidetes bacterium]|nr:hypothetical protein [Bacteroidota bacterium]
DEFIAQSGVIIDAYQYHVPVIVSNNKSLSYLVRKDNSGFVYNDDNIAKIFLSEIHNDELYRYYINNIKKLLKTKYDDIYVGGLYKKMMLE